NLFFQGNPFANERMAADFATRPDPGALLNLHERSDLHLVADFATIKIDEPKSPHSPPHNHIRGYLLESSARHYLSAFASSAVSCVTIPLRKVVLIVSEPNGMIAPPCLIEADAASSTLTTCNPWVPLVSGVLPSRMHSRKCWHST